MVRDGDKVVNQWSGCERGLWRRYRANLSMTTPAVFAVVLLTRPSLPSLRILRPRTSSLENVETVEKPAGLKENPIDLGSDDSGENQGPACE